MGKKSQNVLFSENQFCSLSIWDLQRLTPWVFWCEIFIKRSSLYLLSFGWDLSSRFVQQDWKQTFYWSLPGPKGRSFVCETIWFLSWVNTHPLDLKFVAFCPEFSGDSCVKFQEKTISREFFRTFCANQGYSLPKLVKFTQVLSYVVCTQVRRHVHKRITKRRYGEEKLGRFVFWKPILFTLGLGLTTPYSLGVLVWNFYQTFVTVSIEFWLRFEPQIHPKILETNFLLITSRSERKVRLCVKLFDFFRGWILIRLTWNLSRFVPDSVEILAWNFRKKKTILGEFFRNFRAYQGYLSSTKTCEISPYFLQFLFCVRCVEKIHTSTFICCLHPGKEARP